MIVLNKMILLEEKTKGMIDCLLEFWNFLATLITHFFPLITFGQLLTKFLPFFSDENKSGRKQRINATCKSWPIFLYEQVSLRHFMFSEPSLMIVCDHEWTFLDNGISFSSFCGNHLILSTHLKGTSLFKLMVSKTEQNTLQPRWRDGIFSFLFPRQNNDHFTGWGGEVVTFTNACNWKILRNEDTDFV